MTPRLMTRETLAAYLDVSPWTVDKMRRAGDLSYIAGRKLFDRKAVDAWLDKMSGLDDATASEWSRRLKDGQGEV